VSAAVLALGAVVLERVRWMRMPTAAEARVEALTIHQKAWRASFDERGLPAPAEPREGWFGERWKNVPDPELGWRLPPLSAPGRYEIDADGLQVEGAGPTLLVTGGSVAAGFCASAQETTWFARLARRRGVRVVVCAAGAWRSSQEVAALRRHLPSARPAVALMLTGVNDLTLDTPFESNDDVPTRARRLLSNIALAASAASAQGVPLTVALQPMLTSKEPLTEAERPLTRGDPRRTQRLREAYASVRAGLDEQQRQGALTFIDLSRAFDGQPTTFIDDAHFTDPGHAIVADALAQALELPR
jgi:lysophospholipase L1-like esterase